MYLVGADHPNKERAIRRLDEVITGQERLVTDVEVLQEILHRFAAIQRLDAIQPAFDAVLGIVDDVLSVSLGIVEDAKRIVLGRYGLSPRDALHVAVMHAHQVDRILSFDADFDRYPGLARIS